MKVAMDVEIFGGVAKQRPAFDDPTWACITVRVRAVYGQALWFPV